MMNSKFRLLYAIGALCQRTLEESVDLVYAAFSGLSLIDKKRSVLTAEVYLREAEMLERYLIDREKNAAHGNSGGLA